MFPNSATVKKTADTTKYGSLRNTNSLYSYRVVLSSTGLLASSFTQAEILTQTSRRYTMPRRVVVKAVGGYEQLQVGLLLIVCRHEANLFIIVPLK